MESAVILFPEPDSPTNPDGCLRGDRQIDTIDRLNSAPVNVKLSVEIFYPEEIAHRCRGSSASRIPSPMRLIVSAVTTSAVAGKKTR